MRLMAFSLTEAQVLARTKTVTRRLGWRGLKPGTLLQPVRKAQGLKKGEGVVRLGYPVRVVEARQERLDLISATDVVREGFPDWTREQFLEMFTGANHCPVHQLVTRIAFEYLDPLPAGARIGDFSYADVAGDGLIWVRLSEAVG